MTRDTWPNFPKALSIQSSQSLTGPAGAQCLQKKTKKKQQKSGKLSLKTKHCKIQLTSITVY